MSKIVFFDTETTGMTRGGTEVFKGHRIVEVAFLAQLPSDEFIPFQQYLNPDQAVSPEAFAVHGLADAFLKGYPKFEHCAQQIVNQIQDAVLIAHNAPFDIAFLDYELAKAGFGPVTQYCAEVIDTLVIARKKFPGQKNSLDALCQRFGISIAHRSFHGGLKDCYLLSQVYRCLRQGQRLMDFASSQNAQSSLVHSYSSDNLVLCPVTPEETQRHEKFITDRLS